MAMKAPSMDEWLREAKAAPGAENCGMYLFHNGVVRRTSKAAARQGRDDDVDYDEEKAKSAAETARAMPGIRHVRVWLNRGRLLPGDDIMLVLVGGDIRPHVVDALQALVGELKEHCVTEREVFEPAQPEAPEGKHT